MAVSKPATSSWGAQQPWKGLFILLVSLLVSSGIAASWKPDALQGFPFAFAICLVPVFVVMGSLWKGWPMHKLGQPARGLLLLALALCLGSITFMWTRFFIGGGELSPLTNMFGITVVTLVVVVSPLLQFWPFAGRLPLPFAGICWLIALYLLGFVLFRVFYSFSAFSSADWYRAGLDPGGRFPAEVPLTVVVMGLPFAFALMHLEMWPFSGLKQPWRGLASCVLVWVLAGLMYLVSTSWLGFGAVEAQVKFGVYGVFGMMMWIMMFEGWPGRKLSQPLNGFTKILIGIALSVAMFYLVRTFGRWAFGAAALEGDGLYTWMATVALGLCFPFFAMYTTMFQSWPLPEPGPLPPGK